MKPGDLVRITRIRDPELGHLMLSQRPGPGDNINNPIIAHIAPDRIGVVLATTNHGIRNDPEVMVLFGSQFGWNAMHLFEVLK